MTRVAQQIDLLTGAYCRNRFEEELLRAVHVAKRNHLPLSLVHIDIDELQEMNDLHGYELLNNVLSWLAKTVSEIVDGKGPIGRVGGDEFAVLLECVTSSEAQRVAERIHELVPQTLHASQSGDFRLTVSVGVASLRPDEPPFNLLEAAEQACLRAKQGGRNSVVGR